MKTPVYLLIIFASFFAFQSCNSKKQVVQYFEKDSLIQRTYETLIGSYSSQAQAAADTNYHNMTLDIVPITALNNKEALYLYAEQYDLDNPNRDKIQTVYKIMEGTDMVRLLRFNIMGRKPQSPLLEDQTWLVTNHESVLKKQAGCTVYLNDTKNEHIRGITLGSSCINRFMGSSFSRLEMLIYEDKISYLEQGFDEYNKHVWGPKRRGIQFIKKD